MNTKSNSPCVLGVAALMLLAGSAHAQSSRRTGTFAGTIPSRAMGAPSPSRTAAPAPAPAAMPTAAAARAYRPPAGPTRPNSPPTRATRTGSFAKPTPAPIVPPQVVIPSGGGRAALPGTQSIMPRNTGAGLAPTQVVVPEATVLPPKAQHQFDHPLVGVEPHNSWARARGGSGSEFVGPQRPNGDVGPGPAGRYGTFATGSSGFSANVRYSDDNFRLGIHVGSAGSAWCRDHWNPWWSNCSWYDSCGPSHGGWCGPSYGWCYPSYASCYPWGWSSWPYYYDYSYTLPVTSSSYVMYQDPALAAGYSPSAPAQVVAPPTEFERATTLMQGDRFAEAVGAFRSVIKTDPGDAPARRWLGIALLLQGRTQDGAAEVARAYSIDPSMADSSPDLEAMGLSVRDMTDLCAPVITYARRVNSSSGYVAAAMLMQVRSRPDLAAKMLNSAREAGLESGLLVQLTQGMAR